MSSLLGYRNLNASSSSDGDYLHFLDGFKTSSHSLADVEVGWCWWVELQLLVENLKLDSNLNSVLLITLSLNVVIDGSTSS